MNRSLQIQLEIPKKATDKRAELVNTIANTIVVHEYRVTAGEYRVTIEKVSKRK